MGESCTRIHIAPSGLLTRQNAARYLGVAYRTMIGWDTKRIGPQSYMVGGLRMYYKDDLDAFIGAGRVRVAR